MSGVSHPLVAVLLGLGAAGLAAAVVAMAWSVHTRQLRLAEQLARRQLILTAEADTAVADAEGPPPAPVKNGNGAAAAGPPPVIIDGPETLVAGEQARYRVRAAGGTAVWWGVGGGPVSHSPDPAHPGDLLLVAAQPGDLLITARVREGVAERRATKPVTAVADVAQPVLPFPLRLFLQGWGLVTAAVLIIGFGGALAALGTFPAADFIALAVPVAAMLAMAAAGQRGGSGDPHPGGGRHPAEP